MLLLLSAGAVYLLFESIDRISDPARLDDDVGTLHNVIGSG